MKIPENKKTNGRKKIMKTVMMVFSRGTTIAILVYTLVLFWFAFLAGGEIIFSIDDYNEGDFEILFLTVIIPFLIYDIFVSLKKRILNIRGKK